MTAESLAPEKSRVIRKAWHLAETRGLHWAQEIRMGSMWVTRDERYDIECLSLGNIRNEFHTFALIFQIKHLRQWSAPMWLAQP